MSESLQKQLEQMQTFLLYCKTATSRWIVLGANIENRFCYSSSVINMQDVFKLSSTNENTS